MPCLTHWHIWLCHMEVGRTLVLSPSTYNPWESGGQDGCVIHFLSRDTTLADGSTYMCLG
jgi:hypothetical protein